MTDVSIVLALHRERHFVPRTLQSLAEAAHYARGSGISTELVAVLDRSDAATAAALQQLDTAAFDNCSILHVDNGSLGPTRNDGCRAASGTYILTADGDDLISFNTIERMFSAAEAAGPDAILIPQFIFAFGASYHIAEYFDLEQVTPLALLASNPFVSRVFFHHSLRDRLSYDDVSLSQGYAYEDWHFNCNAVALGYTFRAVPDTVLFYRQRTGSLLNRGNQISVRQIPPSRLFQPKQYLRVCQPWVEQFVAAGDRRESIGGTGRAVLEEPVCVELMYAANAIDPAVHPDHFAASVYLNYLSADIASGLAYYRLCMLVGEQQFDEVFLLPFMTAGGADRYLLDIIREMARQDPSRKILILFGEPCKQYVWLDLLPAQAIWIDLISAVPELSAEERELLCLKLIQSCAGKARLHFRPSPFAHRFFVRFAPVLTAYRPIFYRFADARSYHGDCTLVIPWSFQLISDHLGQLDTIICDCQAMIDDDRRRIGAMPEKWKRLYTRRELPDRLDEQAVSIGTSSREILWVSRLDEEKRPGLLLEIARLLARSMPDVLIHVYGQPTLNSFDLDQFSEFPNLRYHGFFERFEDLRAETHYCFLYTSRFDGMPIVLLEMMGAGLPVIAPDVGGIGEIVHDGDTGVLLPCGGDDAVDAETYLEAIETLFLHPERREELSRRAFDAVRQRHGVSGYAERVAAIFELGSPAVAKPGV